MTLKRKLTERDYERVKKLCLMDDILMKKCLEGHNECVELIIRIILKRNDLIVLSSSIQETLTGPAREVRLDIFATDKRGKKYDIEFQRAERGAKPKRARYNSSMIDVRSLDVGTKTFSSLPEVYVIFITETDVLKGGLPIYTIDRVINETGKKFGDASHIIYVNGAHRDSDTALGKLMHDLFCTESGEMNYAPLADRVKHIKGTEKGVREVSTAWEEEVNVESGKRAEKRAEKLVKKATEKLSKQVAKQAALAEKAAKRADIAEQTAKQAVKQLAELEANQVSIAREVAQQEKEGFALRMLKAGEDLLKVVEFSGLSMTIVKRLAKTLTTS